MGLGSQREAHSMHITAADMQDSSIAVLENALAADEDELERVVEKP
jgi:hypothetical protein